MRMEYTNKIIGGGEWSASRPGRALPPGKDSRYSLYRRLGGPQSRSGHRGYKKNSFDSTGNRTSIARSSSPQQDIILTELPGSGKQTNPTKSGVT
jgi:hypothetical protein